MGEKEWGEKEVTRMYDKHVSFENETKINSIGQEKIKCE